MCGSDEDFSAVRRRRRGLLKSGRKSIRDVQMFGVQTCVQKCCIFTRHFNMTFLCSCDRRCSDAVMCFLIPAYPQICSLTAVNRCTLYGCYVMNVLLLDVGYLCSKTCCVAFKCLGCCWEVAGFFVFSLLFYS